jgi:flagellar hook-associated protein 1 FlgK
MNIYSTMNTAKWALAASQTSIEVTGQNVANINNPDYNKQTANIQAGPTQDFGGYSIGTGITISSVSRQFDQYLFNQTLDNNTNVSLFNSRSQELNQINTVMNDTSGNGLGKAMDNFFQAFQSLGTNPTGATERQNVISNAQMLSTYISNGANQMKTMQKNENSNITLAIPQVNALSSQIANMNKLIHESETNGNKANDYRDQREGLLNKLSGFVGINYFEQSNGEDVVMLKNGSPLVVGEGSFNLSSAISTANPQVNNLFWNDPSGRQANITNTISGGQIGAWMSARDGDVANTIKSLDTLAGTIITQVNNQQAAGFGLDGTTGLNFFNPLTPGGAGAVTNLGNGVVTGALINGGNPDLDHYRLSFDGTNYSVTNTDKGGVQALAASPFATVQSFFQQRGYNINITGSPQPGDAFDISAVNNAAIGMSVNSVVANDINKVAAGATTQPGDGSNAKAIGNMQSQKLIGGAWTAAGAPGVYSLNDFYGGIVGSIGTSTKTANDSLALNKSVQAQISNMRQQSSGVNMDEEMVNLVKFQHSYQAAAKTLSTVDQMLQALLNIA